MQLAIDENCNFDKGGFQILFGRFVRKCICKMHNIDEQLFIDISLVFNGLDFQSGSELGTPYISVTFLRLARNTCKEKLSISLRMLLKLLFLQVSCQQPFSTELPWGRQLQRPPGGRGQAGQSQSCDIFLNWNTWDFPNLEDSIKTNLGSAAADAQGAK